MSQVLDSSMTLAWYFEDQCTDAAIAVCEQVAQTGAVVPPSWRLEVANGLHMAIRRGRINAAYRDASLADLRLLPIITDTETDNRAWAETLYLAERFQLTFYDAAYLELALRRALPLATLDANLRTAAETSGVKVLGFSVRYF